MTINFPKMAFGSNIDLPLSCAKIYDYLRFLGYILYFPQVLPFYEKQYFNGNQSSKRKNDFVLITLLVSLFLVLFVSVIANSLLMLDLKELIIIKTFWSHLALSIIWSVSIILIYFPVCLALNKYLWMALLLPLSSIIASITFSVFFRFSELPMHYPINMPLAIFFIGLSCGILYSILSAYVNYGIPKITHIIVCGLLTSFIVLPTTGFSPNITGESTVQNNQKLLILSAMSSYVLGFVIGSLRIDDWLLSLVNLSLHNEKYFLFLPHVTPLTVPNLEGRLHIEANKDWKQTIKLSKYIWIYTCQHTAIIRALYKGLLTAKRNDVSHQIATLESYKQWQLSWFVQGNKSSISLFPDMFLLLTPTKNMLERQKRELRKLVDNLTNSQTKITQNEHMVNRLLIGATQKALGLFTDERKTLEPIWESSLDVSRRFHLLGALEKLKSINDLLNLQELELGYLRGKYGYKGIWFAIECLTDTFDYIRLIKHCTQYVNRTRIVDICRRRLQWLKHHEQLLQITQEERDSILGIITNWEHQIHRKYVRVTQGNQSVDLVPYIRLSPQHKNPYIYDEPLRRKELLKGRNRSLAAITKSWQGEHLSALNITGPILFGKTSLVHAAVDENKKVILAYLSLEHLNTSIPGIPRIANAICDILTEHILDFDSNSIMENVKGEPYRTLEVLIRQICKNFNETKRALVLTLDDFDHVETVINVDEFASLIHFLYYLSENIPNFGLVIIGNFAGSELYHRFKRSASKLTRPIKLQFTQHSTNRSIEQLLHNPSSNYYCRFDPEAIDHISRLTGGNPYLVQLIAWIIFERYTGSYTGNPPFDEDTETENQDPFFTDYNVSSVLDDPLCKEGVAYYQNRLLRCFGKDSDLAARLLDLFNPRQKLSLNEIVYTINSSNSTNSDPQTIDLLRKFVEHRVLKREGLNYTLAVEILNIDTNEP